MFYFTNDKEENTNGIAKIEGNKNVRMGKLDTPNVSWHC